MTTREEMFTPFEVREIDEARAEARRSRRRLVEVLEDKFGLDPDVFVGRLGVTIRVPVMSMAELRAAKPAFDLVPFAECAQRNCALLRDDDGTLSLVIDDPFSGDLDAWADERIAEPFAWRLVHHGDLVAWLASQEETMHALDAVHGEAAEAGD